MYGNTDSFPALIVIGLVLSTMIATPSVGAAYETTEDTDDPEVVNRPTLSAQAMGDPVCTYSNLEEPSAGADVDCDGDAEIGI